METISTKQLDTIDLEQKVKKMYKDVGGASQQDDYRQAIENAGMEVLWVRNNNAYGFISKSAKGASKDYGVKSVSLLAQKIK